MHGRACEAHTICIATRSVFRSNCQLWVDATQANHSICTTTTTRCSYRLTHWNFFRAFF